MTTLLTTPGSAESLSENHLPRRAPLLLRLSSALNRRGLRGGTRLYGICSALSLYPSSVIYPLPGGGSVEVPLPERPFDDLDLHSYEAALVDCIAAAVSRMPRSVKFYDCGADFGLISAKVASRCPNITDVIAFEPNARMLPLLSRNIARLRARGEARSMAVGDRVGRGRLCHPAHDPEADEACFLEYDADGDIDVTCIDAHPAPAGASVAMKLDIEGSEIQGVRGAMETLRRAPEFVVAFEAHPVQVQRYGVDPVEVIALLQTLCACDVVVAESPDCRIGTDRPFFEQLGRRQIVNVVVESRRGPG